MFRILPGPYTLDQWKDLRELQNELAAKLTPEIAPAVDPKPLAWAEVEERARRSNPVEEAREILNRKERA